MQQTSCVSAFYIDTFKIKENLTVSKTIVYT